MLMKHGRKLLAAVIIASAASIAIYKFWPRPTLEEFARNTFECLLANNADCVYDRLSSHEKAEMGLDRRTLREFINELYVARQLYAQVGAIDVREIAPRECFVGGTFQDKGGHKVSLSLYAYDSGKDMFVGGIPMLFYRRYQLEFPVADAELDENIRLALSVLKGLNRDQSRLESLGMKGVSGPMPYMFQTWNEYRAAKAHIFKVKGVDPAKYGL